jgi:hypothetical protein
VASRVGPPGGSVCWDFVSGCKRCDRAERQFHSLTCPVASGSISSYCSSWFCAELDESKVQNFIIAYFIAQQGCVRGGRSTGETFHACVVEDAVRLTHCTAARAEGFQPFRASDCELLGLRATSVRCIPSQWAQCSGQAWSSRPIQDAKSKRASTRLCRFGRPPVIHGWITAGNTYWERAREFVKQR